MVRRAARGGKVEVTTELGPKWLPLLPMCSFSIMETILTLNTSMNSLEECFCRCEQHLHHHTRLRRLCADMVWSARKVAILCLNDFPQGISIFTITREIRYLNFFSFARQEGDWYRQPMQGRSRRGVAAPGMGWSGWIEGWHALALLLLL